MPLGGGNAAGGRASPVLSASSRGLRERVGLTVLVDVAGHYPTPLVLVVVTRVTRKTPAEPPPAAACPCPLERPRPAGR